MTLIATPTTTPKTYKKRLPYIQLVIAPISIVYDMTELIKLCPQNQINRVQVFLPFNE